MVFPDSHLSLKMLLNQGKIPTSCAVGISSTNDLNASATFMIIVLWYSLIHTWAWKCFSTGERSRRAALSGSVRL